MYICTYKKQWLKYKFLEKGVMKKVGLKNES